MQRQRGLWDFLWEDVTVPRFYWYSGCFLLILGAISTTLKILAWLLHLLATSIGG